MHCLHLAVQSKVKILRVVLEGDVQAVMRDELRIFLAELFAHQIRMNIAVGRCDGLHAVAKDASCVDVVLDRFRDRKVHVVAVDVALTCDAEGGDTVSRNLREQCTGNSFHAEREVRVFQNREMAGLLDLLNELGRGLVINTLQDVIGRSRRVTTLAGCSDYKLRCRSPC